MRLALDETALARIVATIVSEPSVARLILFGSRAKGNNRPGSDIDLCVEGSDLSASTLAQLETELDDLLLPWEIDLVPRADITDPNLLAHIDRVGIVLFTRSPESKSPASTEP